MSYTHRVEPGKRIALRNVDPDGHGGLKKDEAEEKTASGIVLPDAAKEKPTKGKVIAVGPGKLSEKGKPMELSVRVNDMVYYGKYSGTDVEVNGQKFVILRESDILGVLE